MLRPIRTVFRLLAIARTLARHDALAPLQELGVAPVIAWIAARVSRRRVPGRAGQKLAAALTDLGPSFIKLGQFLSTRADLLGDEIAADLSELQDRLPPFASAAARATIELELNRPIGDLFKSFDDRPISAASIAQVHFAVTRDDPDTPPQEVAVKVLRPAVERAFARDIELFYTLAELVEGTQPKLRRFKLPEVVRVFEETVKIEMDLRMEAAAASELAENFRGDSSYRVPSVDWQRSSRRVLTLSRLDGIPLDDKAALLAAGHNLEAVLTKAAQVFFKQVFRDGFFHGDQHPGNMFVDEAGNITAVDFGIMGRLDQKTRRYLADMMLATVSQDYHRLAEVHVEAGYLPPGQDLDTFAQALRSVCEPIIGRRLNEISFARLLAQLFQITESFAMPVQPQLLLLQKNMLMAEGISRSLEPDLNIWMLARPLIEEWMREHRGPEARLRESATEIVESVKRLPAALTNLATLSEEISKGGLRLHPETLRAFDARNRKTGWHLWALWIAGAALALLLLID